MPEWTLLRAPFEVLADDRGLLASDALLQFSVARRLGEPAQPVAVDHHRLGVRFMASAPRGQQELDFEAEETAILAAVGDPHIDLVVEESGNPDRLASRLAPLARMSALHLSCHGHHAWRPPAGGPPRPVLFMEDDHGDPRPTVAAELVAQLGGDAPALVVLSACLSARATAADPTPTDPNPAEPVAQSFATALVEGGHAAVLGWDGSVADVAATAFARELYAALARRQDLAVAVGTARRALLNATDERWQRDWPLARLWLGPGGGGPIVGGTAKRSLLPATHGHKAFLDKGQGQVPVASHEMFVRRRRQLQRALVALDSGDVAGVVLHGMGRLGKSSLAARIANRRRDLALAVVFERYGALSVLDALHEALRAHPPARDLLAARRDEVVADASHLEPLLIDLLYGPCRQSDGGCPVLLVIDDLERVLVADKDGGHHPDPATAPVLAAVLRAFDPTGTDSRLVITSRLPFRLEGLEAALKPIQLPPMSPTARHKLQRRQSEAVAGGALSEAERAARGPLLARAAEVAGGNPGLQDLIGLRLVLSAAVPAERAEQTLEEMENWLGGGTLPDAAEVRAFLENLALDTLQELAGPSGRDLLRALSGFDVPVPASVATTVADAVGGSVDGLRASGCSTCSRTW